MTNIRPRTVLILALTFLSSSLALRAEQTGQARGAGRPPVTEDTIEAGRVIYRRGCISCHGASGKGDGPAVYFLSREIAPRPRDFTRGAFKYRSTPSGALPTDDDLFRVVTRGRVGLMPSFAGLSREQRWSLVYYLKTLVPQYERGDVAAEAITIGSPIPATAQSIGRGEQLYQKLQCWKCHGVEGEGDGPSGNMLKTAAGLKILAADLTQPGSFGNGSEPQDVYRTIMTGLNGVPMPSYAAAMTEQDAWDLANYVLSMSREGGS